MEENQKKQQETLKKEKNNSETVHESKPKKFSSKEKQQPNVMAIMSYLGFLCLVPILSKSEDDFVMFHAKQG